MLRHLAEKVDPRSAALLLVDVQNDFCAEGGAMHREGRDLSLVRTMIPRLERCSHAARAAKVQVRVDPQRLQHRPQLVPLGGLAGAGQAPAHGAFHTRSASRASGTAISSRSGREPDEVIVTKHRSARSKAPTSTSCCARAASAA